MSAVVQTWLMRRGMPLVYSKMRCRASSVKRVPDSNLDFGQILALIRHLNN